MELFCKVRLNATDFLKYFFSPVGKIKCTSAFSILTRSNINVLRGVSIRVWVLICRRSLKLGWWQRGLPINSVNQIRPQIWMKLNSLLFCIKYGPGLSIYNSLQETENSGNFRFAIIFFGEHLDWLIYKQIVSLASSKKLRRLAIIGILY